MTGPEHYREAERLTAVVTKPDALSGNRLLQPGDHRDVLALAQVHATLALAAATAVGSTDLPSGDWDDWRFVASAGHAGRIPGSEREVRP